MPTVPRDVLERLYAGPPDGFVAARSAAAAAARKAGDPATARAIGELRKPTMAAWLVNLLALRRPDLLDGLVELSSALRAAQRDLRGAQLRELSTRRREVVAVLVATARELAVEVEPRLAIGKLPLGEVETTLTAALSDVDVAEQVRSGRLVRAAHYAGFGEVPRPQLRLVTGGPEAAVAGAEGGRTGRGRGTVERGPAPGGARAGERAADGRAVGTRGRRTEPGGKAAGPDGKAARGRSRAEERAARAEERAARAEERAARAEERAARKRVERERAERERRAAVLTREVAKADDRQRRAEAELDRARTAEREGAEELAGIEATLADLERRRAAAEGEAGRRKLARKAAERALSAARRHTGEVQAAIEELGEVPEGRR